VPVAVVTAVVLAGVLASIPSGQPNEARGGVLQAAGIMLGASARPRDGEDRRDAVTNLEHAIGRALAAVRVYRRWDHPFPTSFERWLRDSGHTLFLSVAARRANGEPIPWRAIADAPVGSSLHLELVRWAERIRAFGATVYLTLSHEPETENRIVMGDQQDFIDAWRRFVTVFRSHGVSNVRFTWILTAYTFARTDGEGAASWYPGDTYVDAIGADGYNFFGCRAGVARRWRSFAEIFEPARVFASMHPDKELVIPEWASVEDEADPNRKAAWIEDARATLTSPGWGQVRAVLYYHSISQVGHPPCAFWVDTSERALDAFRAMGADPYLSSGRPPLILTVSPTSGPPGTRVTIEGSDLVDVRAVSFHGVKTSFTSIDPDTVVARVPLGATAGPVAITTSLGTATGPVFRVVHPRRVSLSLGTGSRAHGVVRVEDGYVSCARGVMVRLERLARGGWRTVAVTLSQRDGRYRVSVPSRPGPYRAALPRVTLSSLDICGPTWSEESASRP
jgi:hypothetical protein